MRGETVPSDPPSDPEAATEPTPDSASSATPPAPSRLVLSGEFRGHQLSVTLVPRTEADYRLTSRGFHWFSEFPYNR